MNNPRYTLDDLRFGIDGQTFEKAVGLYKAGKVAEFSEDGIGYSAMVIGTHPYKVYVHGSAYDRGMCTCYLGERDELCKHMIALALYAIARGRTLAPEEVASVEDVSCSGVLGELSKAELKATKAEITTAMRKIKSYAGPSRTWFAYQDSLSEGCRRLSPIVSRLPVSKQTATILIDLLIRIDSKLATGGVDDSDGTVGGFAFELVQVLVEFFKQDHRCVEAFERLVKADMGFGFEDDLIRILDEGFNEEG
ncbi:MAG: hypothetical protein A2W85_10270 [Bacteroidetes bacterium GWF2_41_31]|nr:MAG: hypothetical protein A2W85_10270 [Bacteroidetes bacterium GWF2_41_31]